MDVDLWPDNVIRKNSLLWDDGINSYEYSLEPKFGSNMKKYIEMFKVPIEHPAFPGLGLRAKKNIKTNTLVGVYGGYYRKDNSGDPRGNAYIFNVGEPENGMVVDGKHVGNITRFINDPTGYEGKSVNIKVEYIDLETEEGRLVYTAAFTTIKNVKKGEELFYSYESGGSSYWDPSIDRGWHLVDTTRVTNVYNGNIIQYTSTCSII